MAHKTSEGDTQPIVAPSPNATTPITPQPTIPSKANQKLKRFRFIDAYDMILLKAVRSVDAHIPEWGKSEALYEELRKVFLREVPLVVFTCSQEPSGKTLADRFKRLLTRRRDDVKRSSAASGIVEEHGEKEVLLDDLIAEIDEKEEALRAEKEKQTENEKRLVAAGTEIRNLALKRKGKSSSGSDSWDKQFGSESGSARKRKRKREAVDSDNEITSAMLSQAALRSEMEKGRLEVERAHQIGVWKSGEGGRAFRKEHEATQRRLDLDEKRFAVEAEERKVSIGERKKMVDVMELLVKKLQ